MLNHLIMIALIVFGMVPGISHAGIVSHAWESEPNYGECKQVFMDAFLKCYGEIPLDVLRQPSRKALNEWLAGVFDDTYEQCSTSSPNLLMTAKVDCKVIGFIVIDTANYPKEIYLSQLAVDPAHQRQGIASSLVHAVIDQFSDCDKFVVITRRANNASRCLYTALGFTSSAYMHEGYDQELYMGFEYINHMEEAASDE